MTTQNPANVSFAVTGDWGTGFTADLTIRNTGTTPINGWTLNFNAPYSIDQHWSSVLTKLPDGRYSVKPLSWNTAIPAGGSITFGFRGAKAAGTRATAPTNYQLNGVSLTSGAAPTATPTPTLAPALPDLIISDTTLAEGALNANGAASALFKVSLSKASSQSVTVGYATQNGSAIAGQDFTAKQGTLTFAPGETSKNIAIPILNDTRIEPTQTFKVLLSNASQAKILDSQGIGTILDNDTAAPAPTPTPAPAPAPTPAPTPTPATVLPGLSIGNATLAEGALSANGTASALFKVSLSKASSQSVTVGYATQSDSAIAGQDFTAKQGTLTFAPGETSKDIAISILNDTLVEPTETFKVVLSDASQASIVTAQGTGTILDDDVAPTAPSTSGTPTAPSTGKFNYAEALQKSFLFYEAQRSGDLPGNNRIQWRGDSAMKDGSDVGRDLTGGYYDAGDHVKFNFPMASSLTMLSWGVREYREAYNRAGQLDDALSAIRWGTDYLLKCHVTDANGTKEFWGQVGDGNADHSYWGSPEKMTMARPSFKIDRQNPGSDLAGEAAAALASASIVFRKTDAAYADKLLDNAIQLYTFADTYRGKYSDSITDAKSFYNSWSGYQDELSWGAAWIHEAQQAAGKSDTTYLNKAKAAYTGVNATFSWDNKSAGVGVLLAQETGDSLYRSDVERLLNSWLPGGGGVTYTSGGLAWGGEWGSLRSAANMAFVGGVYADTVTNPQGKYSTFAEKQIDYILGDNPRQSSYMVGFGKNSPVNPHHRAASGTDWGGFNGSQPNAHILYGALVGGPSAPNDFAYKDLRNDYVANEVATDYNAAFTGAMARMVDRFGGTPLNDAQLDALPGIVVQNAPAAV
ncbi:glycoside hydrolase family 9 protein [Pseudanabaena sp. FACHB-2040]|uniref:glycoside hydrolase family 9 protein n=1 Tax=Pseudanabaena sp. FACHB-2040 TaxID=2692859 RepID=UPI00168374C6|nr:glycoside hydrolase family 9 protein [Pseudanabaena sp. FACHB-2040]MBD2259218.1 glycoside hydrolase family 9 protein [Pseudanabaena sp. FACHB-2040]